jgi:NADH-quinone oxidoreductase subunit L
MIMLMIVTGIGSLIHIYATGYMAHEEGYYRFFAYLNLFMFFMLNLVLAANYLLLFVGWEGVGLCSYLLIGFYFVKKSATTPATRHSS